MSKLSFRARALDASKPLPVFRCEDLPDLHEYASINRAVPQMPTGMEKEEESVCFNGLNLWKYAGWLYFIFLNDRRRPSFFSAQAFTKWPPFFPSRNTTNLSHNCCIRAVMSLFRLKGDAMYRCGINWVVFTGIFIHEALL